MPDPSISVEFGEVHASTLPGFADEVGQQLINYVSFRQGTYMSYNPNDDHIPAIQEIMTKSTHYVQHEMPTDALRTRDDYQSILELATR